MGFVREAHRGLDEKELAVARVKSNPCLIFGLCGHTCAHVTCHAYKPPYGPA